MRCYSNPVALVLVLQLVVLLPPVVRVCVGAAAVNSGGDAAVRYHCYERW